LRQLISHFFCVLLSWFTFVLLAVHTLKRLTFNVGGGGRRRVPCGCARL
jgi:hypothetical protein